jgi:hypothetical protein
MVRRSLQCLYNFRPSIALLASQVGKQLTQFDFASLQHLAIDGAEAPHRLDDQREASDRCPGSHKASPEVLAATTPYQTRVMA